MHSLQTRAQEASPKDLHSVILTIDNISMFQIDSDAMWPFKLSVSLSMAAPRADKRPVGLGEHLHAVVQAVTHVHMF
jgi:hypothetical protein